VTKQCAPARVKVGRYLTGSVIISEGLKDGEKVVVAGGQLLHPGMQVEIAHGTPAEGQCSYEALCG
jgi:membrane fusion protein, multidrug efflux system